jgi:hypothetical protein
MYQFLLIAYIVILQEQHVVSQLCLKEADEKGCEISSVFFHSFIDHNRGYEYRQFIPIYFMHVAQGFFHTPVGG